MYFQQHVSLAVDYFPAWPSTVSQLDGLRIRISFYDYERPDFPSATTTGCAPAILKSHRYCSIHIQSIKLFNSEIHHRVLTSILR
jgi:hypothetical protein